MAMRTPSTGGRQLEANEPCATAGRLIVARGRKNGGDMTKATEILRALDGATDGQTEVSLGRVNEHIGHRGTGALLMLPAALELTPIGGIPGVPTAIALVISIFAVQILIGREDMWLPGFLERRSVSAERLADAIDRLHPAAEWADRHTGRHLRILTEPPAPRIVALAIVALCATVPVLELIPFASSIPMGTIVLFGFALLTRDGRVLAVAWAAFVAAVWGVWRLWPV